MLAHILHPSFYLQNSIICDSSSDHDSIPYELDDEDVPIRCLSEDVALMDLKDADDLRAVSYTHLTLPTICSV